MADQNTVANDNPAAKKVVLERSALKRIGLLLAPLSEQNPRRVSGVYVCAIEPKSFADDIEGLELGMWLIGVNGENVAHASLHSIASVLNGCTSNTIELELVPPDSSSSVPLSPGVTAWATAAVELENAELPSESQLPPGLRKLISHDFNETKVQKVAAWVEEVRALTIDDKVDPSQWPTKNSEGLGIRFNSKNEVTQCGTWAKKKLLPVALGRLLKLGGMVKTWKSRIFELKFDTLSYFLDEPLGELCGEIKIQKVASVERADNDPDCLRANSLRVTMQDKDGRSTTNGRVFYMVAESEACCELWIRMILDVKNVLARLKYEVAEIPARTTRRERRVMMSMAAPAVVGITIGTMLMGIGRNKNALKFMMPKKKGEDDRNRLCWNIEENAMIVCLLSDLSVLDLTAKVRQNQSSDNATLATIQLEQISQVESNRDTLIMCDAVPPLVRALQLGTPDGKRAAAAVLSNLAIGSAKRSATLFTASILQPTLDLIKATPGTRAAMYGTGILFGLARGPETRKTAIGTDETIELLVEQLEGGLQQGRSWAAGVLLHLASGSEERREKIVSAGAIAPLVKLLSSDSDQAHLCAAGTMVILSENLETHRQAIADTGAIPLLVNSLRSGSDITKSFAAGVILNMVRYDTNIGPSDSIAYIRRRHQLSETALGTLLDVIGTRGSSRRHIIDILLYLATDLNQLKPDVSSDLISNSAVILDSIAKGVVAKSLEKEFLALVQQEEEESTMKHRLLGLRNLINASPELSAKLRKAGASEAMFMII